MSKTPSEIVDRYQLGTARGSLVAFLEGTQTLSWLIGMIRYSNVRGEKLLQLFAQWNDYGDTTRYNEAISKCQELAWFD